MRVNRLTTVLSAGYVAADDWYVAQRVAGKHRADVELATRQHAALGYE